MTPTIVVNVAMSVLQERPAVGEPANRLHAHRRCAVVFASIQPVTLAIAEAVPMSVLPGQRVTAAIVYVGPACRPVVEPV
jgi:hypothetical protein